MAMSVAARVVSERVRSSVLGIVSAAGSLGALLSVPMGRFNQDYGWRIGLFGFVARASDSAGRLVCRAHRQNPATQAVRRTARQFVGGRGGGEGVFKRRACSDDLRLFHRGMQLVFIATHLPSYLQI